MALKRELELRNNELPGGTIETIYFGGGTPSILETEEIEGLIKTIDENFRLVDEPEITLEANPDDLSVEKIQQLSDTPINRLSIGIQSFFDQDLKLMNRAHTGHEAFQCLENALTFFPNTSIDLIYGIPGMSDERWKNNVAKALQYNVPHISAYALTVEPRTALDRFIKEGKISNVDDEQAERQFHILVDILNTEGFVNYEISNFGKPNFFSKNNTAYWQGKPYLGIGPSAHSFDGRRRGWNLRNNVKYIKAIRSEQLPITYEVLSVRDQYNEYVMTGLRTIWGISLNRIREEFGPIYEKYLIQQAEKHVAQHFLFWDEDRLLTTNKGKFLADGIASDLFMINLES